MGFEDCCVLRSKSARQKYTGSYEQAAKAFRTFVAANARPAAMAQVFRTVALSVVIWNGDAHLKNSGIVYDSSATRQGTMPPAFDLVTTTPYPPQNAMALTMKAIKCWPDKKTLEEFGRTECGLNARQLTDCLADVEHVGPEPWKT